MKNVFDVVFHSDRKNIFCFFFVRKSSAYISRRPCEHILIK